MKKARDILEFKVLDTFDFMDDRVEAKLGVIRERINKIEVNMPKSGEREEKPSKS